jgi:hypothetical protein
MLAGTLAFQGVQAQDGARPLALTYRAQLEEYGSYRRIPDTTAAGAPDAGIVRLEIDGLVVDQTITKLGRDFYQAFYQRWEAPEEALNFTITVQEQPLPNIGTGITVLVNDEIAFQTRLQPREDVILASAQQAISLCFRRLMQRAAEAPGSVD